MVLSSVAMVGGGTTGGFSVASAFVSTAAFSGGGGAGMRNRISYKTAKDRRNAMSTLFSIVKTASMPGPTLLGGMDDNEGDALALYLTLGRLRTCLLYTSDAA